MTTDHDLTLAISRAVDAVRDGINEPVWVPLEALLPAEWCDGWMFMGGAIARVMQDNYASRAIWSYKHGITRHYLHIGDDLRVYRYRSDLCEIGDPLYERVNTEWTIHVVYDGIEELGATRSTAYNAEYVAARNARLVAAGYQVIG